MYRCRFELNTVLSVKNMHDHANGLTLSYPF